MKTPQGNQAALLRITTVEYDAGMEIRTITGWGVRLGSLGRSAAPGAAGLIETPLAYLIVKDRERPIDEQEITQIPWSRIVSVVSCPDL